MSCIQVGAHFGELGLLLYIGFPNVGLRQVVVPPFKSQDIANRGHPAAATALALMGHRTSFDSTQGRTSSTQSSALFSDISFCTHLLRNGDSDNCDNDRIDNGDNDPTITKMPHRIKFAEWSLLPLEDPSSNPIAEFLWKYQYFFLTGYNRSI